MLGWGDWVSIFDTTPHLYSGISVMKYKDVNHEGNGRAHAKQGKVATAGDAEFRGYVNLQLSSEEKSAFAAWAETAAWSVFLDGQVDDGINISTKRDGRSDGFLTSATQRRVGSPNAGLVLTARGSTATLSLLRCLFSLAVLSHYEKWEERQPVADPDRW